MGSLVIVLPKEGDGRSVSSHYGSVSPSLLRAGVLPFSRVVTIQSEDLPFSNAICTKRFTLDPTHQINT